MVVKEFKEISIQITLKRASNDNTSLPKHLNIIMKESWKGKKRGRRKQISTAVLEPMTSRLVGRHSNHSATTTAFGPTK